MGAGIKGWTEYSSDWHSILAKCIQLNINNDRNIQILLKNKRKLLLSKALHVSGYDTHVESHDLGRANYMMYIYGILNTNSTSIPLKSLAKNKKNGISINGNGKDTIVTRIVDNDSEPPVSFLLNDHDYSVSRYYSDVLEEKNLYDSLNILGISSIYIDRLEILPSKRWNSFIHHSDSSFLPKQLIRPLIGL
jgi:hypothetical protein